MTKNNANKKRTSTNKSKNKKITDEKTKVLGVLLSSPTKTEAAKRLGIGRTKLYELIDQYELEPLLNKPVEDALEILAGAAPQAAQGLQAMLSEAEWKARLEAQKEILDRVGVVKPQKGTQVNIVQQFNSHKGKKLEQYELD